MTLNTAISKGWIAAVAAAILATVAALSFLGVARAQSPTSTPSPTPVPTASVEDLIVGSVTVAPEESVTVNITGTAEGLAAYRLDIAYDSTKMSATGCTSGFGTCSNDVIGPGIVRVEGGSESGITGDDVLLGTITFLAGPNEGTVPLTIQASVLTDAAGGTLATVTTSGSITIVAATPTATAAAVPQSGGDPGTSSSDSMAWLLAAGLVVMFAGGGAWVLARAGREN